MNWNLMLHWHKKDNLSEMPGFLSGGLIILICGEASMLSASIRKMFHLFMFADFIWRHGPETVFKLIANDKLGSRCLKS